MNVISATQTPFGSILSSARQQRGWSRARLSKESGISENSIVRYEKAGIEADGQFPPAPKLAALCFTLGISTSDALLGCLPANEFDEFVKHSKPDDEYGFPLYRVLAEENVIFAHENAKLKAITRAFILQSEGNLELNKDVVGFLKSEFYSISPSVEKDDDDIFYVDDDVDDEDIDEIVKQNGPDQNDPSRSNGSENNDEAVGAVSTSHDKGGG